MGLTGFSVQIPSWLGGMPTSGGGGQTEFGMAELLLSSTAVAIIFIILLPRWLADRRKGSLEAGAPED